MFGLPPAAAAAEGAPLLLLAASAGLLLVAALDASANIQKSSNTNNRARKTMPGFRDGATKD
jgi:hypothetical protein